eukprot:s4184_g1.t1
MLDELIEDLNKEEAPTAVVKSAMRAGQAVAPMAAPGPAPEALAVVPWRGRDLSSCRLHYLLMAMEFLDTKEVTTGDIMVMAVKEAEVGMGFKVVVNEVMILVKDMELITELKLAVVACWGLLHFLLDLL